MATWALIAVPVFPGRANNDTINMVEELRAGEYTDWWSPLLMMVWKPFYEIGFGLGFILLGQIAVFFVGIAALIRPLFVRTWPAVATAVAICLFPTSYAMLINVIRDTWMTVAVVGCLAVIYRSRRPAPIHGALLLLGCFGIVAARQNGVFVIVVIAAAAIMHWGLLPNAVHRSIVRRGLFAAAVGVVVGAGFFVTAQLLVRVTDVTPTGPETSTYYVDLDEMSTRVGEMLVPEVMIRDTLTLDDLAVNRNYNSDAIGPLVFRRLPPEDRPVATDAWRDAITTYPRVYLQARWQMFTRQLGWSGAPLEPYFPTEVSAEAFPPRSLRLSELSTSYLSMFDAGFWQQSGIVHRPWIYVAISVAAAWRFGRRWPLLYTIPGIQVAVFAGLFFLTPISKVRLVYPVYAVGLVSFAFLVLGAETLRRRLQESYPQRTSSGASAASGQD
ncbi:MAG: hypothetical protein AAGF73_15395 [Actinomycetota bacterium]